MATKTPKTGDEIVKTAETAKKTQTVTIAPPNFGIAEFHVRGEDDNPLVVHRFSLKVHEQLRQKMEMGKPQGSRKNRAPKDFDALFNEARYVSPQGWDGFKATAVRNSLISACRLVGFKMTLAKLSLFALEDGRDAQEPQVPLIRLYSADTKMDALVDGVPFDARKQEDWARVETGQPYITVRAAYFNWAAKIRVRFDADQFTLQDVTNLMMRVGMQVGWGEGRPDSKNSAGLGWGLFRIEEAVEAKAA
jgi:hypothetical protein